MNVHRPCSEARRPWCRDCHWFYITHQPGKPYGCQAMGFISTRMPCQAVRESSGMDCQAFRPKEAGRGQR